MIEMDVGEAIGQWLMMMIPDSGEMSLRIVLCEKIPCDLIECFKHIFRKFS